MCNRTRRARWGRYQKFAIPTTIKSYRCGIYAFLRHSAPESMHIHAEALAKPPAQFLYEQRNTLKTRKCARNKQMPFSCISLFCNYLRSLNGSSGCRKLPRPEWARRFQIVFAKTWMTPNLFDVTDGAGFFLGRRPTLRQFRGIRRRLILRAVRVW